MSRVTYNPIDAAAEAGLEKLQRELPLDPVTLDRLLALDSVDLDSEGAKLARAKNLKFWNAKDQAYRDFYRDRK